VPNARSLALSPLPHSEDFICDGIVSSRYRRSVRWYVSRRTQWQEVTGRVVGNLSEYAFGVTPFTAEHPFRIGRHSVARMPFCQVVENKADTLSISTSASGFTSRAVPYLPDLPVCGGFGRKTLRCGKNQQIQTDEREGPCASQITCGSNRTRTLFVRLMRRKKRDCCSKRDRRSNSGC
jgi:hypothetical protein